MSERWGRALAVLVKVGSAPQKSWRRIHTRLCAIQALIQPHRITTRHGDMVFAIESPSELDHLQYFLEREPETRAWIDGFATPCRFWDIGANIGVFTLYAALRQQVEVYAFEPSAATYQSLCRNIHNNGLSDRAHAFCLAIADRTALGVLNLSGLAAGRAFNIFDGTHDYYGREVRVSAHQGMVGYSIDGFREAFGVPVPHYIKIDVDSIEDRILAGANATLRDPELRSVSVELEEDDTPRNDRICSALLEAGLQLTMRSKGVSGAGSTGIFARS
jgi:FkbM family methyltransferase